MNQLQGSLVFIDLWMGLDIDIPYNQQVDSQ